MYGLVYAQMVKLVSEMSRAVKHNLMINIFMLLEALLSFPNTDLQQAKTNK